MEWQDGISYFFGGAFFMNAIPHLVSGLMGRAFQTPFAKPPGQGLSSSTVNALWGFFNLAAAYLLTCRVGNFDFHVTEHAVVFGLGGFIISLIAARRFGRFNGGNLSGNS